MTPLGADRWNSRIRVAALVALLLGIGYLLWWQFPFSSVISLDATVEGTAHRIRSWGAWGVAGSIGLMIAHSFVPFPAEILACANGMIYGPLWGTVITWVGAMLGASAAFGLARILGRPYVHRMLSDAHRGSLADWSRERGGRALLLARLIPVIAFNLINYAAALTEISWWTFLWATGIGILPLTVALAVTGDQMLAVPLWGWVLVGLAAVAAWLWLDRRWRAARERR